MSDTTKSIEGTRYRLDFIQSQFPATWTIYEIIEVERLIFYCVFMASCAISQSFYVDDSGKTIGALTLIK